MLRLIVSMLLTLECFVVSMTMPSLPFLSHSKLLLSQGTSRGFGGYRCLKPLRRVACHRNDDSYVPDDYFIPLSSYTPDTYSCNSSHYGIYVEELLDELEREVEAFQDGSGVAPSFSKHHVIEIIALFSQMQQYTNEYFEKFMMKVIVLVALHPEFEKDDMVALLQEFDVLKILKMNIMKDIDEIIHKVHVDDESFKRIYWVSFQVYAWSMFTPSIDHQRNFTTAMIRKFIRESENDSAQHFLTYALQAVAFVINRYDNQQARESHFGFEKMIMRIVADELFAMWQNGNTQRLQSVIQRNFVNANGALTLTRWSTSLMWLHVRVRQNFSDTFSDEELESMGIVRSVFQSDLVSFFSSDQVETEQQRLFAKWLQEVFHL